MVTPILEADKLLIMPYFPKGFWYDYYSGVQLKTDQDPGSVLYIYNNIGDGVPIFVRGGKIIPLLRVQENITLEQHTPNYDLVVAL
jgi:alpha-glucosidase (family GH31 glycosyl hydrolase)